MGEYVNVNSVPVGRDRVAHFLVGDMTEILMWAIGGVVFFLLALFFLSVVSVIEGLLAWVKRRWL